MNNIQKLKVYGDFLNVFENPVIRNIVEEVIINTPTIFFGASTSSSGKYHPVATNGLMGLVKHSIAVMLTAQDFFRNETIMKVFQLEEMNDTEKEIILAACLLHDNAKYGSTEHFSKEKIYTNQEHPRLIYDIFVNAKLIGKNQEQDIIIMQILNLITAHMGQWNKVKDGEDLPVPDTYKRAFVHLCDYVASRKTLDIVSELSLPVDLDDQIMDFFILQNN